ncbi:Vegetative cell wall protein gp1 precursor (Hydroxyproline-rich glycoprotein 1) [Labilithrix luteola]|uniref:Vegetative cell wall protein gp1 (Hydroxyproline-rich glycoprotein 1) n=1 Tax=Labilithrix luteola TaxID=1391654 RepID=A0A0K1PLQ6_9BACT|nr:Vegetative cell wall protein gp1 precursor (Hydroxyproline-rich glycoprotein 1) [Labilithrix luteola]
MESGIGEPAFIPLCLGQELQPLSVGKKGMWKLESPRMLDVHAFFYFDGNELFAQSADDAVSALVDGRKIGKAWTQLNAPCSIDVGGTRLRYRSLADNAGDEKPTTPLHKPLRVPSVRPTGQEATAATMALPPRQATQPPRQATQPPRQATQPPRQATQPPPPNAGPLPARSAPPPPAASSEPSFGSSSRAERPFRAGEFSAPAGEESTRVAPLDVTGVSRRGPAAPRPAAGRPPEFEGGLDASQARNPARPPMGSVPPGVFMQAPPPPQVMMPSQPVAFPPPMQGMPPTPPPGAYGNHYPAPVYSAPPAQVAPYVHPQVSPSGTYGSSLPGGFAPTPSGTAPSPVADQSLGAKWAALSIPKKILIVLAPFSITSAIYLFVDEPPPPRRKAATTETSARAPSSAAPLPSTVIAPAASVAIQPGAQAWPPGVPCPPPGWPANTPLPCIPNGAAGAPPPIATTVTAPVATPVTAAVPATTPAPSKAANDPAKDASASAPATKTLERQAVEALAANDYAKASALYGELARRDPQSAVYGEAARIARSKLDGGAP